MFFDEDNFNTKYRDKYRIEREKIVKQYAEKNKSQQKMLFTFGKNSEDESKVNAMLYEYGKLPELVILDQKEILYERKINAVLLSDEGKLYLDEEATNTINNELEELVLHLQKEQEEEMKQLRIEEHIYKVSEIGTDRIWLYDITNTDEEREEIEELEISEEILKNVVPEDVLIYKQGEYHFIEK